MDIMQKMMEGISESRNTTYSVDEMKASIGKEDVVSKDGKFFIKDMKAIKDGGEVQFMSNGQKITGTISNLKDGLWQVKL